MKVFGIVGWSGSGKTALIEALLPELIHRGLRVSTMKHIHHDVDLDSPGKDSFRHRRAGATEVLLLSSSRWTLMHEVRDVPEPTLDELLPRLATVDLVLLEGFKAFGHDKLEVWRACVGKSPLYPDDPRIVALASDTPIEGVSLPAFVLHDIDGIADFVLRHCGLADTSEYGGGVIANPRSG